MDVDLPLLLFTTLGTMLSIFIHPFINFVLKKLFRENKQNEILRAEIAEVKREISHVSMVDEFARYARLQRKIIKLQETLKLERQNLSSIRQKYNQVVGVCFSVATTFIMVPFIYMYRGKPVVLLPSKWLSPLSYFIAWPSDDIGAVSVLCWSAVCNGVSRIIRRQYYS